MHPYPSATAEGVIYADLSHEAVIAVRGADAVAFLQGQLSTDIEALTPTVSQFSSWSNAKGRVVTLLRLWQQDDTLYMTLPGQLLATVLKRLSLYMLRSKVTLMDAGSALARKGLAGKEAPALLTLIGWPAPLNENTISSKNGATIVRLHGTIPRYAISGPVDVIVGLQESLEAAGVRSAGYHDWTLLKILAREPTVYPETSEHFVAQMLDLDKLGGIDFKKGCYIGQEIIARAHYRGGVKRHLLQGRSEKAQGLAPGSALHAEGQAQPVGEVVDARRDAQGIWQLLAVVQDESRNAMLKDISGSPIEAIYP
jgi:folate-binding protein YgfZ